MKTDDELVKEIMEAGYGYEKPSALGTAAHFGAKMLGKAAYKGVKAGIDAYQNSAGVQMKNQGKLRQAVLNKLNTDFAHWSMRTTGSQAPRTEQNLLAFMNDLYGYNASADLSAAKTSIAATTGAAPQSAPETPPAAETPPEDTPAAAPSTGRKRKPAPKKKAAPTPEPAPAPEPAPTPRPRDFTTINPATGKPVYRHNSNGIDFDDPTLQEPIGPKKDRKTAAKKESIDLSKSFSEILAERASTGTAQIANAFFDMVARKVLGTPQAAQAFLQGNQIGGAETAPAAAGDKNGAAPKDKTRAAPKSAAPAAPDNAAMKAELNQIITSKLGVTINPATIQSLVERLKQTPNLKDALDLVDSPAEIEAARAVLIAVLVATEM